MLTINISVIFERYRKWRNNFVFKVKWPKFIVWFWTLWF